LLVVFGAGLLLIRDFFAMAIGRLLELRLRISRYAQP
jgi:hypothetical protein